jgi:hypothetical protein
MRGKPQLLHIVRALHTSGRFPGRLYCRQKQSHQNADNGNDDQQLHQRKTKRLFHTVPRIEIVKNESKYSMESYDSRKTAIEIASLSSSVALPTPFVLVEYLNKTTFCAQSKIYAANRKVKIRRMQRLGSK